MPEPSVDKDMLILLPLPRMLLSVLNTSMLFKQVDASVEYLNRNALNWHTRRDITDIFC